MEQDDEKDVVENMERKIRHANAIKYLESIKWTEQNNIKRASRRSNKNKNFYTKKKKKSIF